ncbi:MULTISPECIES: YceI family protein [Flavobacteriaceae]|uniref:YceI family protein n=2 Tax=Flavobacteriaceae TaxID=49546 RepID=A0A4Y8AQS3_9FLAO|nr:MULTISPECIES: YceI family protein [Flavobacteriaceae]TEW72504.1 YceI family protein [Gramella jeungdoensis]GGK55180.1 hypothetical protein GCM10007963_24380 [Lutibacter litoralis]
MFLNKTLVYFILGMTTFFTSKNAVFETSSVIIKERSTLLIKGESNINNFSCLYDNDEIKKTIPIKYTVEGDKIRFDKTVLLLNNTFFDCGGNGINRDLRKTLNTEDYPQIALTLNEIERTEDPSKINAEIAIKIAGISHNYRIPIEIIKNQNLIVNGQLKIKLTDFNLNPPKKLFGIIAVDNKIEITFNLEIEEQ